MTAWMFSTIKTAMQLRKQNLILRGQANVIDQDQAMLKKKPGEPGFTAHLAVGPREAASLRGPIGGRAKRRPGARRSEKMRDAITA
jgi:hypothetical protein